MGSDTNSVKRWLRSRHVLVLDEWIQACVEWIHQEYEGTVSSTDQLCQLVYEQWLDSDLSEIALPCLPSGARTDQKMELQGNFALQMNSVQDVSTPAYAQLVKLQGRENENVSVSAEPVSQRKFEPKANRLLMLTLTDGSHTIQAMEYQMVPTLNLQLTPGTKILLSGKMMCRRGVILLTPAHVRLLGGEVEALKETNSQEQLLTRAINDPEPQPFTPKVRKATPGASTKSSVPKTQVKTEFVGNHSAGRGTGSASVKAEAVGGRGSTSGAGWGPPGRGTVEQEFLMEDDDGLDELMMEELETIERQQQQQQQQQAQMTKEEALWELDEDEEEQLLAMDWDDDFQQDQGRSQREHVGRAGHQPRPQGESSDTKHSLKQLPSNSSRMLTSTPRRPFSSAESHGIKSEKRASQGHVRGHQGAVVASVAPLRAASFQVANAMPLFKTDSNQRKEGQSSVASASLPPRQPEASLHSRISLSRGGPHRTEESRSRTLTTKKTIKQEQLSQEKSCESRLSQNVGPGESTAKRRRIEVEKSVKFPFIYLIDMEDAIARREACQFDIKGFIMTLVSGLSHVPEWNLIAKINDGTMSLDVDISDPVLTGLIGFSVPKMQSMRNQVQSASKEKAEEIKNEVKQGLARCQRELIDLSCIMTIEMMPAYDKPRLVAIRKLTIDDCRLMRESLSNT
ncbi:recQ-mediated genome instability protein 1-like [Diadema antillarum]|uniref:recQ-mediated genome instability protein 1-like n=1 Tax=Diadema antillarum TaxID=105358 RepID=UPI003A86F01A